MGFNNWLALGRLEIYNKTLSMLVFFPTSSAASWATTSFWVLPTTIEIRKSTTITHTHTDDDVRDDDDDDLSDVFKTTGDTFINFIEISVFTNHPADQPVSGFSHSH